MCYEVLLMIGDKRVLKKINDGIFQLLTVIMICFIVNKSYHVILSTMDKIGLIVMVIGFMYSTLCLYKK